MSIECINSVYGTVDLNWEKNCKYCIYSDNKHFCGECCMYGDCFEPRDLDEMFSE